MNLRKYQRGNIVIGVGLPPTQMVAPDGNFVHGGGASPGGAWTSDAEYSVLTGDLTAIWDAFNASGGRPRAGTLEWSPDGTILTLSSSTSDDTKCFQCSTPWNPNTAAQIFSYPVTNPGWGQYNASGTLYGEHSSTDTARMRGASGFCVSSSTILSDVSKSQVGFTSSTDGPFIFGPNFDYMLWLGGDGGGDAIKNVSIPGGNLDAFVVTETYNNGIIDPNGGAMSPLTKDERIFWRSFGSQGVQYVTFDSRQEISSYAESGFFDLRPFVSSFDFRISKLWLDPNDTRFVWGIADPSSNLQLVRFATNVPTF